MYAEKHYVYVDRAGTKHKTKPVLEMLKLKCDFIVYIMHIR